MQIAAFEKPYRNSKINDIRNQSDYIENVLGLLPMSHIYGLVVISHASVYRGDGVIVLPKFEFASTLQAIQDYKINSLFLVSEKLYYTIDHELTWLGSTYYYFDDQKPTNACQVRS